MLEKVEINTGRQIEFDYMKGSFTPMILLIHAFQVLRGAEPQVDAYKIFYIIATMTGSAIFMFVLGLGSTYSRRTNAQMAMSGVKLLLWQLLWNTLAMAAPMVIGQTLRGLFGFKSAWVATWELVPIMLQYINIFFIAGMCYFLLAFLRQVKIPTWAYFALALVFAFVNPFLYMYDKRTGIAALDYVLTMFVGDRAEISLCCVAHFPYALLGTGFGMVLRRTENKARLYKIISIPAALLVIVHFVYAFLISGSLDALYVYSSNGYVYPGTLRTMANCASILLMGAALYALSGQIRKWKPLHNALLHFNKMTTPYYAVHPFFYGLFSALALYAPYSSAACVGMTFVVWALCFLTLLAWNSILQRLSGT